MRVCDEVVGATALGLVDRGFDTVVRPALNMDLADAGCIGCGQCVSVCPTGALTEKMQIAKQVPLLEETRESICSFCSVGCRAKLKIKGDMLIRNLPSALRGEDALLCAKGRFGFGEISGKERLQAPMIMRSNEFETVNMEQAVIYTNKSIQGLQARFGKDCIAVSISERYTNEEVGLIHQYAKKALQTSNVFSFGRTTSAMEEVFGTDASTATIEELAGADVIMLVGCNLMQNHAVVGMKVRRAVEKGAKLITIGTKDMLLEEIASMNLQSDEDLSVLKQITKAAMNAGIVKNMDNAESLASYLSDVSVSNETQAIADTYIKAKKAIIIFEKSTLSVDAVRLLADISLLSGHSGKPRDGILQLLPGANSQGLSDMNVGTGEELKAQIANGRIKGLFIFGENVTDLDLSCLSFLAVQDLHMTQTAQAANVIFPGTSFAESAGSFTGADGRVQAFPKAIQSTFASNAEQLCALAEQAGQKLDANLINATKVYKPTGGKLAIPCSNEFRQKATRSTNELLTSFEERILTMGI